MSMKWPGGLIRKTPVTPAGPLQNGAAPGMWSLAEAAYWTKQGLWPTAGNFLAVEDVFSTWLYTGNGTSQTITNGINLSGQGGLVWTKSRNDGTYWHSLCDTVRGAGSILSTNDTIAQFSQPLNISGFTSTGFTVGNSFSNTNNYSFVSWTFREAPKFFDVVTFTTTSNGSVTFNHSLGVTPGAILFKSIDGTAENWWVWHRSTGDNNYLVLNTTAAQASFTGWCAPTSTQVVIGTSGLSVSKNYVAYLFAHDATSDGIIQCGSYTGNGSSTGPIVTLGWEPQWLLIKSSSTATDWWLVDNMRGFTYDQANAGLQANSSNAESSLSAPGQVRPLPTGFQLNNTGSGFNNSGSTYIYIAIRRGPMRTPTLGTSVYESVAYSGNAASQRVIGSTVLTDMIWLSDRTANSPGWSTSYAHYTFDRLRGDAVSLATSKTAAEISGWAPYIDFDMNIGWDTGATVDQAYLNGSGTNYLSRSFKRAPGFFDEVCYTGTGSPSQVVNHNLGVQPELIILKCRNTQNDGGWGNGVGSIWSVVVKKADGNGIWFTNPGGSPQVGLNTSAPSNYTDNYFANTQATATSFQPYGVTLSGSTTNNGVTAGNTYVAYLFASCPGVSKVGSYTGNGTSQTINCGFSSTARFILIKRTDNTGDWYTWDAATGLVAGNDPHLSLNTAAAEVTTDDSVDTNSTGFIVNQDAATNINVNGATYIFLAVA